LNVSQFQNLIPVVGLGIEPMSTPREERSLCSARIFIVATAYLESTTAKLIANMVTSSTKKIRTTGAATENAGNVNTTHISAG
jgi:hypothetical protein